MHMQHGVRSISTSRPGKLCLAHASASAEACVRCVPAHQRPRNTWLNEPTPSSTPSDTCWLTVRLEVQSLGGRFSVWKLLWLPNPSGSKLRPVRQ